MSIPNPRSPWSVEEDTLTRERTMEVERTALGIFQVLSSDSISSLFTLSTREFISFWSNPWHLSQITGTGHQERTSGVLSKSTKLYRVQQIWWGGLIHVSRSSLERNFKDDSLLNENPAWCFQPLIYPEARGE